MSLGEILALLGAVGSIAAAISVVYLALQTRAATRGSELASYLAGVGTHDRLADLAMEFDRVFIERPELRKYIHEHEDFRHLEGDELARVLATAEFALDFFENTLRHGTFDNVSVPEQWLENSRDLIHGSPAIRHYLNEKRSWYDPRVLAILRQPPSTPVRTLARRGGQEIVELQAGAGRAAARAELAAIYEASFPAGERENPERVFGDQSGDRCLVVGRSVEGGRIWGFATLIPLAGHDAFLLEYLATSPDVRGQGLGGLLVQSAVGLAADLGADWVWAELEREDASADARRRVGFYSRLGWSRDSRPAYAMPDFEVSGAVVPMDLFAIATTRHAQPYDLRAVVPAIYEAGYGELGRQHLPGILNSIQRD